MKIPDEIYVVVSETGPFFCAEHPAICHDHINETLMDFPEITDAAKWVVRRYVPEVKS